MKGKAYANRKPKNERPKGDLYHTPKSLVWVAEDIIKKEFKKKTILDPCCGHFSMSREIEKLGYKVILNDLYSETVFNKDYTKQDFFNREKYIITNPPFSLFDKFVIKAKTHCKKFMFIGKTDFFSAHKRNKTGLWNNLKAVYIFDRKIDLQTPLREDGLFHVGMANHAWFLWDMKYKGKPTIEILDVQKYAKLGQFKKVEKCPE